MFADSKRHCVITGITGVCFYQLSTELEGTCTGRTRHAKDNRVFLEELLKRTGRNGILIMLVSLEVLFLCHHLLHNREGERSLSLDRHLRIRRVDQVSNRFLFLLHIANQVNLGLRDDVPSGIRILSVERIPLERNKRQTICIDSIKRLRLRNTRCFDMYRSSCLQVDINDAIRQGLEHTVLQGDRTRTLACEREVLNRRGFVHRTRVNQLRYTLTGSIVFILYLDTHVIRTIHHIAQVDRIPNVSISSLCVARYPVERNSRRAAGTRSLFGQTDLKIDILSRDDTQINRILLDVFKHVT